MERKRPKPSATIQANEASESVLVARKILGDVLGIQYGGLRDLYDAFGWKKEIDFKDFYAYYKRNAIAKAIIKRPANDTWAGDFEVLETDDGKDTTFEKEVRRLQKTLKLKTIFSRLDRITSLGRYGVLLFGLSDCRTRADFAKPVNTSQKDLQLLYTKPISEANATIYKFESNPASPRYGLPLLYSVNIKSVEGFTTTNTSLMVHHSRVLHVCWDLMEDENYGTPVLESVFNNLMDIEKLAGGSAEMFWRGARPGLSGEIDKEFSANDKEADKLREQLTEYIHNLRRFLVAQGVTFKEFSPQVEDPTNHIKIQIALISAVTGIPQRVLLGSEQGELASSQDASAWKTLIQNRRTEQAEQIIVRPFIDRLIEYGILPKPSTGVYSVLWSDIFAPSEKERAETGKIRAAAIQQYLQNPIAVDIIPPKVFYRYLLGLDKQQLEFVENMIAEEGGQVDEQRLAKFLEDEQTPTDKDNT